MMGGRDSRRDARTLPCDRLLGGDSQLLELCGHIGAMLTRLDGLIDGEENPVFVNVKRPALGKTPSRMDNPVSPGHILLGIAQNGIVQP